MAGQKDKNIVCVVKGLTDRQAARLMSEIMTAKNRIAPGSRSTGVITTRERIGNFLASGRKMIAED